VLDGCLSMAVIASSGMTVFSVLGALHCGTLFTSSSFDCSEMSLSAAKVKYDYKAARRWLRVPGLLFSLER
jgi:hypothetical protein